MESCEKFEVDGATINPVSVRLYQELMEIELQNDDLNEVFPYKPDTPRYSISKNDVPLGYFKVLSSKRLANNSTTKLRLHRQ